MKKIERWPQWAILMSGRQLSGYASNSFLSSCLEVFFVFNPAVRVYDIGNERSSGCEVQQCLLFWSSQNNKMARLWCSGGEVLLCWFRAVATAWHTTLKKKNRLKLL